ncbi:MULTISPECIES: 50S ribosomal protein L15 [Flavobacterium]|jgi:large subunit ribosomal protein L15|uniref:Large ribosomal subunit protein uL15 n=2 Tax=Flavobacterium TaxID=237 RepID=A0A0A2MYL7_9FLAO|nr:MULTISPECIES: 50S ribosomal protein L15 [Flavobacterium]KGO93315.1 50S ribosomal protein L15 [Flavobacterium subsaxonicum WB 4.1-42 = DSM 21790]TRW26337.1 50S ribosomal protein L15 [Flavobacterium zepuense]
MDLSNLQPAEGSVHNKNKRLGRGEGSGKGGTASRGHKGAKSRSGYSKKIGFEGGQMPLQRRVPKFGFKNINRKEYEGVNLDTLQALVDNGIVTDTVDFTVFVENRLATKNEQVKILGRGELKAKLKVTAHKFTATAKAAIEAAGGEAVSLSL